MSEKEVSIDDKVEKLEAAVDPNTVISIGGYNFTPAKLMIAGTIITSILGGLYGAFEVYKDYMDMKAKIQEYVAPDLSEIQKKLELLEQNTNKSVEYTQDIKNDLKTDIRRNESVTEQVERSVKQAQRETEGEMREMRKAVREDLEKARQEANAIRKEMADAKREINKDIETLKKEVDNKIQKAMDNPLAGK